MNQLKNEIKIDRAVAAVDNASKEGATMRNSSKKAPWFLRFAPGAILRIVSKAVSTASAIIQPIRQRLNQWNWRKKTALVTALAITAAGVFYQQRTHAAAFTWPAAIAASVGTDFLVNVFASYASSRAINSKIKKTANANPDGEPLYRHREYHKRTYYYGEWADNNGGQNGHRIDAVATAKQNQTYKTSGTDSQYSPSTLDADEVIDYYVNDNANLNGYSITYKILMEAGDDEWDHLHTDVSKYYNALSPRYYTTSWGGYVKAPTDAEIQAELDEMRTDYNNSLAQRGWQRPRIMGKLKLGGMVSYRSEEFVCEKKVKLWSKFEFNRVPGDTSAGPKELQTPGNRSTYVTEFSYIAREAGYNGNIVTKVPENETPFFEYPKPKSYVTHKFMPFDLTQIPWGNFAIIGDFTWTGEATRFFKHRKVKWCIQCNQAHPTFNWVTWAGLPWHTPKTRHEYPVYQNETVEEPSN